MNSHQHAATVYVVDDDPAVGSGLKLLMNTTEMGIELFASAEKFLETYRPSGPGCLLLDVRMSGMSGPELHEQLLTRGVDLPVIFISGHGDIPMAVRALQKGAVDFVEKPFRGPALLDRVRHAIAAHREHIARQEARRQVQARLESLTPRERQVMSRVVAGLANKQIAVELGVTIKAIEAHRARVMRKMSAGSLAELVRMVVSVEKPAAAAERPEPALLH